MAQKIVINENTKTIVIAVSILCITLFISYKFIYKIYANKISILKSEIEEEKEVLRIRQDLQKMETTILNYRNNLYKSVDISVVKQLILDIADRVGVKVLSFEKMEPEMLLNYSKEIFYLKLTCDYDAMASFIAELETLPKLLIIEEIVLGAKRYYDKLSDLSKLNIVEEKVKADAEFLLSIYNYTKE